MTEIFHLSLPVSNLERSRRFYEGVLGAKVGRVTESWLDVWWFGVQMTIQQDMGQSLPEPRGKFHFGGTLEWRAWEAMRDRLKNLDADFMDELAIDERLGQAKMYLKDPDGYIIELKAYKNIQKTLQPPA